MVLANSVQNRIENTQTQMFLKHYHYLFKIKLNEEKKKGERLNEKKCTSGRKARTPTIGI